jgi:hypothetical protein
VHQSIEAFPKESSLVGTEPIGRRNGFFGRQFFVKADKFALPSRFLSQDRSITP